MKEMTDSGPSLRDRAHHFADNRLSAVLGLKLEIEAAWALWRHVAIRVRASDRDVKAIGEANDTVTQIIQNQRLYTLIFTIESSGVRIQPSEAEGLLRAVAMPHAEVPSLSIRRPSHHSSGPFADCVWPS